MHFIRCFGSTSPKNKVLPIPCRGSRARSGYARSLLVDPSPNHVLHVLIHRIVPASTIELPGVEKYQAAVLGDAKDDMHPTPSAGGTIVTVTHGARGTVKRQFVVP
jgi:hypothetical protein